nr:carboxypeptidase regulatory-like domain-containing protein [Microbacterium halimionae]
MFGTDAPGISVRFLLRAALTAVVAVALAVSTVQPAAAEVLAAPATSVSGTVTGAEGQPLSGGLVYLMKETAPSWSYTAYAETDANGAYRIEGAAAGTYTLRFFPVNGHVGEWWNNEAADWAAKSFELTAGAQLVGMDAQLSTGASISGTVTDTAGVVVPHATVHLYGMSSTWRWLKTVVADDAGAYSFGVIDPGTYAVKATPLPETRLVDQWWIDPTQSSTKTRFQVSRDQTVTGIDVQLPYGAQIRGTVTDQSGEPLRDAIVALSAPANIEYPKTAPTFSTRTDSEGGYSFDLLKAGEYALDVHAAEGANFLSTSSRGLIVGAGEMIAGKDFALQAGGVVSGTVTGRGGLPVAGARVRLSSKDSGGFIGEAFADENGVYRIEKVVAGSYSLYFSEPASGGMGGPGGNPDHFDQQWRDSPNSSASKYFDVAPGQHLSGMDAALIPKAAISGTVTDADGNLLSADVSLYSVKDGQLTPVIHPVRRIDGQYRINGLSAGTYTLKFAAANYLAQWWGNAREKSHAQTFEVGAGQILTGADAVLELGGSITGTVTQKDGTPVRSGFISVYKVGDDGPELFTNQLTDMDGRYLIGGLADGDYTIRFSSPFSGATFVKEWWKDSQDAEHSSIIRVVEGEASVGIDASLALDSVRVSVPVVSGTAAMGAKLTASVSRTPTSAALAYEWRADGVVIEGATDKFLTLQAEEVGKKITVRVTGSDPRYLTGAAVSEATPVVAAAKLRAETPWMSGSPTTGGTLTAHADYWTSGTTFTYEWFANGVVIAGATSASMVVKSTHAGKMISVRVTGSKPGYSSVRLASPLSSAVYLARTPTVTGTPILGSTLTANSGTWTAGSALKYQWYAAGSAIKGATSSKLKLTSAHAGKEITVRVTGSLTGYLTTARTSAPTAKTATVATPTISGAAATGVPLTAKPGKWTTHTSFTYRWYANGEAIAGATASTFTPTSAQAGKSIKVKVTGSQSGYPTVAKVSSSTKLVYRAATPKISGTAVVGSTMTVVPGKWTTGTHYSYQWYANGSPLKNATSSTLKLTRAHADKQITVRVIGGLRGYPTLPRVSSATLKVMTAGSVSVAGKAAVGSTLTADRGTWAKGTVFTYQWYANGVAVSGAKSREFTVTKSHVGKQLAVRVTGKLPGYSTIAKYSAKTKSVTK